MRIEAIFLNQFGRLRSGWRFTAFLLTFILFGIGSGFVAAAITDNFAFGGAYTRAWFMVVNGIISLFLVIGLGWVFGKYLEDLPFRALGCSFHRGWFKHLIAGSALGAITLAIAAGIAVLFGGLRFSLNVADNTGTIWQSLAVSVVVFAAAAAFEEALFRGYLLQTFARAGLSWLAIGLTAAFFAFVHLGNPGSDPISTLNTALAGIWFGIAYLRTRDLWFPFGIHLMWNWMQGSIFGIEVSGLKDFAGATLLKETDRGPAWLTGENYGIEAGIPTTMAIALSIIAIHFIPYIRPNETLLALTDHETPRLAKPSVS